jgi:hypothetical protein
MASDRLITRARYRRMLLRREDKMTKSMAGAVAIGLLAAVGVATAQERMFLTPADAKMLLVGNKVTLQRTEDKALIEWDIRPDGSLRGFNRERKNTLAAQWSFNNDGAFCVQWRGIPEADCFFYFNVGRQLAGVTSKTADAKPAYLIESMVPLK